MKSIDAKERILTLEDTRELFPPQANKVHLVASKGDQGTADMTIQSLLEASLRMRPDRLFVGEIRGAEAFSFLARSTPATPAACPLSMPTRRWVPLGATCHDDATGWHVVRLFQGRDFFRAARIMSNGYRTVFLIFCLGVAFAAWMLGYGLALQLFYKDGRILETTITTNPFVPIQQFWHFAGNPALQMVAIWALVPALLAFAPMS